MEMDEPHLDDVCDALGNCESVTILVVADASATVASVAQILGVRLNESRESWIDHPGETAWRLLSVPGGVLAHEPSGFGDPSVEALATLSTRGTAAVARSNVNGHDRFGYARHGSLLFDDNEYIYLDDPSRVPEEVRLLFGSAWQDLDADDGDADDDEYGGLFVALAMTELVTGLVLDPHAVREVASGAPGHPAPILVYSPDN